MPYSRGHSKTEPRAVDPDRGREGDQRQRQHGIEKDPAREIGAARQDRHVEAAAAAGEIPPAGGAESEDLHDRE